MTTTSDSGADVHIDWRVVIGVAAALGILFTVQNYWSPAVTRGSSSLERTFLLQIIIWTTWIACNPFVFAVARRWWRDPRLTPAMVAGQVLAAVAVAIIHASLAGTLRWLAGVSAYDELDQVLVTSIKADLASDVLRYGLIASAYHAVAYARVARDRAVQAGRLENALLQSKLEAPRRPSRLSRVCPAARPSWSSCRTTRRR